MAMKTGTGFVFDISSIKIWGSHENAFLRHLPLTVPWFDWWPKVGRGGGSTLLVSLTVDFPFFFVSIVETNCAKECILSIVLWCGTTLSSGAWTPVCGVVDNEIKAFNRETNIWMDGGPTISCIIQNNPTNEQTQGVPLSFVSSPLTIGLRKTNNKWWLIQEKKYNSCWSVSNSQCWAEWKSWVKI